VSSVILQNKIFTYQIKRKSIRSIHLHIKSKNSFYISCPRFTPNFVINRFITKHSNWILKNSKKTFTYPKLSQLKHINILGKKYKIDVSKSSKNSFDINHNAGTIQITTATFYQHHLKKLFEKNLRPLALDLIKKEIKTIVANCNASASGGSRWKKSVIARSSTTWQSRWNCKSSLSHPIKISVRNQKTRFGSCSAKGNLSFNWQIIFFPPDKFRHIILHELVHLKIENHSKNYWHALSLLDPNCKSNNKWLKTHATNHFLIRP